ncbi:hypothetical protein [Streptomyces sp. NPDC004270]
MTTTAREELLRLVPPQPSTDATVDAVDWEEVEDELGISLPDDYKWLSERYWPTRLVDAAERAAELLEQMPESLKERVPYKIDFDGGLVEFLAAVLSGATRMDVFPSDFPSARPAFAPQPDPATVRRRRRVHASGPSVTALAPPEGPVHGPARPPVFTSNGRSL